MGTKYPGINIINYNATPPSDDGAQVPTNEIAWNKHKLKLGDPLKTLSESMNSALLLHVDESVRDLAGAGTVVATDHKRTINQTLAGTVSIDDSANLPAGFIFEVKNSHSAVITVDLVQATDTLDGVAAGALIVAVNETIRFIMNASADGFLSMTSYIAPAFAIDFATQALDQNLVTSALVDTDLQFTGEANSTYFIDFVLMFSNPTDPTPDFRWQLIEPDGTFRAAGQLDFNDNFTIDESTAAFTQHAFTTVNTINGSIVWESAGAGGIFKMQCGQSVLDAGNPTIVHAGSVFRYTKTL